MEREIEIILKELEQGSVIDIDILEEKFNLLIKQMVLSEKAHSFIIARLITSNAGLISYLLNSITKKDRLSASVKKTCLSFLQKLAKLEGNKLGQDMTYLSENVYTIFKREQSSSIKETCLKILLHLYKNGLSNSINVFNGPVKTADPMYFLKAFRNELLYLKPTSSCKKYIFTIIGVLVQKIIQKVNFGPLQIGDEEQILSFDDQIQNNSIDELKISLDSLKILLSTAKTEFHSQKPDINSIVGCLKGIKHLINFSQITGQAGQDLLTLILVGTSPTEGQLQYKVIIGCYKLFGRGIKQFIPFCKAREGQFVDNALKYLKSKNKPLRETVAKFLGNFCEELSIQMAETQTQYYRELLGYFVRKLKAEIQKDEEPIVLLASIRAFGALSKAIKAYFGSKRAHEHMYFLIENSQNCLFSKLDRLENFDFEKNPQNFKAVLFNQKQLSGYLRSFAAAISEIESLQDKEISFLLKLIKIILKYLVNYFPPYQKSLCENFSLMLNALPIMNYNLYLFRQFILEIVNCFERNSNSAKDLPKAKLFYEFLEKTILFALTKDKQKLMIGQLINVILTSIDNFEYKITQEEIIEKQMDKNIDKQKTNDNKEKKDIKEVNFLITAFSELSTLEELKEVFLQNQKQLKELIQLLERKIIANPKNPFTIRLYSALLRLGVFSLFDDNQFEERQLTLIKISVLVHKNRQLFKNQFFNFYLEFCKSGFQQYPHIKTSSLFFDCFVKILGTDESSTKEVVEYVQLFEQIFKNDNTNEKQEIQNLQSQKDQMQKSKIDFSLQYPLYFSVREIKIEILEYSLFSLIKTLRESDTNQQQNSIQCNNNQIEDFDIESVQASNSSNLIFQLDGENFKIDPEYLLYYFLTLKDYKNEKNNLINDKWYENQNKDARNLLIFSIKNSASLQIQSQKEFKIGKLQIQILQIILETLYQLSKKSGANKIALREVLITFREIFEIGIIENNNNEVKIENNNPYIEMLKSFFFTINKSEQDSEFFFKLLDKIITFLSVDKKLFFEVKAYPQELPGLLIESIILKVMINKMDNLLSFQLIFQIISQLESFSESNMKYFLEKTIKLIIDKIEANLNNHNLSEDQKIKSKQIVFDNLEKTIKSKISFNYLKINALIINNIQDFDLFSEFLYRKQILELLNNFDNFLIFSFIFILTQRWNDLNRLFLIQNQQENSRMDKEKDISNLSMEYFEGNKQNLKLSLNQNIQKLFDLIIYENKILKEKERDQIKTNFLLILPSLSIKEQFQNYVDTKIGQFSIIHHIQNNIKDLIHTFIIGQALGRKEQIDQIIQQYIKKNNDKIYTEKLLSLISGSQNFEDAIFQIIKHPLSSLFVSFLCGILNQLNEESFFNLISKIIVQSSEVRNFDNLIQILSEKKLQKKNKRAFIALDDSTAEMMASNIDEQLHLLYLLTQFGIIPILEDKNIDKLFQEVDLMFDQTQQALQDKAPRQIQQSILIQNINNSELIIEGSDEKTNDGIIKLHQALIYVLQQKEQFNFEEYFYFLSKISFNHKIAEILIQNNRQFLLKRIFSQVSFSFKDLPIYSKEYQTIAVITRNVFQIVGNTFCFDYFNLLNFMISQENSEYLLFLVGLIADLKKQIIENSDNKTKKQITSFLIQYLSDKIQQFLTLTLDNENFFQLEHNILLLFFQKLFSLLFNINQIEACQLISQNLQRIIEIIELEEQQKIAENLISEIAQKSLVNQLLLVFFDEIPKQNLLEIFKLLCKEDQNESFITKRISIALAGQLTDLRFSSISNMFLKSKDFSDWANQIGSEQNAKKDKSSDIFQNNLRKLASSSYNVLSILILKTQTKFNVIYKFLLYNEPINEIIFEKILLGFNPQFQVITDFPIIKKQVEQQLIEDPGTLSLGDTILQRSTPRKNQKIISENDLNIFEIISSIKFDENIELDNLQLHPSFQNFYSVFTNQVILEPENFSETLKMIQNVFDRNFLGSKLFILKAILQKPALFDNYKAKMGQFALKYLGEENNGGVGLHYFYRDIMQLLINWIELEFLPLQEKQNTFIDNQMKEELLFQVLPSENIFLNSNSNQKQNIVNQNFTFIFNEEDFRKAYKNILKKISDENKIVLRSNLKLFFGFIKTSVQEFSLIFPFKLLQASENQKTNYNQKKKYFSSYILAGLNIIAILLNENVNILIENILIDEASNFNITIQQNSKLKITHNLIVDFIFCKLISILPELLHSNSKSRFVIIGILLGKLINLNPTENKLKKVKETIVAGKSVCFIKFIVCFLYTLGNVNNNEVLSTLYNQFISQLLKVYKNQTLHSKLEVLNLYYQLIQFKSDFTSEVILQLFDNLHQILNMKEKNIDGDKNNNEIKTNAEIENEMNEKKEILNRLLKIFELIISEEKHQTFDQHFSIFADSFLNLELFFSNNNLIESLSSDFNVVLERFINIIINLIKNSSEFKNRFQLQMSKFQKLILIYIRYQKNIDKLVELHQNLEINSIVQFLEFIIKTNNEDITQEQIFQAIQSYIFSQISKADSGFYSGLEHQASKFQEHSDLESQLFGSLLAERLQSQDILTLDSSLSQRSSKTKDQLKVMKDVQNEFPSFGDIKNSNSGDSNQNISNSQMDFENEWQSQNLSINNLNDQKQIKLRFSKAKIALMPRKLKNRFLFQSLIQQNIISSNNQKTIIQIDHRIFIELFSALIKSLKKKDFFRIFTIFPKIISLHRGNDQFDISKIITILIKISESFGHPLDTQPLAEVLEQKKHYQILLILLESQILIQKNNLTDVNQQKRINTGNDINRKLKREIQIKSLDVNWILPKLIICLNELKKQEKLFAILSQFINKRTFFELRNLRNSNNHSMLLRKLEEIQQKRLLENNLSNVQQTQEQLKLEMIINNEQLNCYRNLEKWSDLLDKSSQKSNSLISFKQNQNEKYELELKSFRNLSLKEQEDVRNSLFFEKQFWPIAKNSFGNLLTINEEREYLEKNCTRDLIFLSLTMLDYDRAEYYNELQKENITDLLKNRSKEDSDNKLFDTISSHNLIKKVLKTIKNVKVDNFETDIPDVLKEIRVSKLQNYSSSSAFVFDFNEKQLLTNIIMRMFKIHLEIQQNCEENIIRNTLDFSKHQMKLGTFEVAEKSLKKLYLNKDALFVNDSLNYKFNKIFLGIKQKQMEFNIYKDIQKLNQNLEFVKGNSKIVNDQLYKAKFELLILGFQVSIYNMDVKDISFESFEQEILKLDNEMNSYIYQLKQSETNFEISKEIETQFEQTQVLISNQSTIPTLDKQKNLNSKKTTLCQEINNINQKMLKILQKVIRNKILTKEQTNTQNIVNRYYNYFFASFEISSQISHIPFFIQLLSEYNIENPERIQTLRGEDFVNWIPQLIPLMQNQNIRKYFMKLIDNLCIERPQEIAHHLLFYIQDQNVKNIIQSNLNEIEPYLQFYSELKRLFDPESQILILIKDLQRLFEWEISENQKSNKNSETFLQILIELIHFLNEDQFIQKVENLDNAYSLVLKLAVDKLNFLLNLGKTAEQKDEKFWKEFYERHNQDTLQLIQYCSSKTDPQKIIDLMNYFEKQLEQTLRIRYGRNQKTQLKYYSDQLSNLNLKKSNTLFMFQKQKSGTHLKIQGILSEVNIIASLRKPKHITLQCSDHRNRAIMVKCGEDLRTDSRIMQIYEIISNISRRENYSGSCALVYNIYPINKQIGVVEWIPDSYSIRGLIENFRGKEINIKESTAMNLRKEFLNKSNNLITQFPRNNQMNKINSNQNSEIIKNHLDLYRIDTNVINQQYDKETMIIPSYSLRRSVLMNGIYEKNTNSIEPIEYENTDNPEAHFNFLNNFLRDYSVQSVISYIFSIGDRHLDNILLNKKGRVVFVDFSCSLGLGLTLSVPELLPIRLTPNIIELLQPFGIEGDFHNLTSQLFGLLYRHRFDLLDYVQIYFKEPIIDWRKISLTKSFQPTLEKDIGDRILNNSQKFIAIRVKSMANRIGMKKIKLILLDELEQNMDQTAYKDYLQDIKDVVEEVQAMRMEQTEFYNTYEEVIDDIIDFSTDKGLLGRAWMGWMSFI